MHNHTVKPLLAALLALFALAAAGCSPSQADDRPLTPAERERLMNSAEARGALQGQQLGPTTCSNSTPLTRLQARDDHFSGPNGFGTLPCNPNQDVK